MTTNSKYKQGKLFFSEFGAIAYANQHLQSSSQHKINKKSRCIDRIVLCFPHHIKTASHSLQYVLIILINIKIDTTV